MRTHSCTSAAERQSANRMLWKPDPIARWARNPRGSWSTCHRCPRLERGCRDHGGRKDRTRPRTRPSRRDPCARWLPPRMATCCECGSTTWACWTSGARAACWVSRYSSLLRGRGESRELADVAHIVLDDDGRLEICRHQLHALDRGNRRRAVEVEPR